MTDTQINDVPEDPDVVLRQPTVDEVLARVEGRAGGSLSLADAVRVLRSDRGE
ncbi:hypothetical protein [Tessaracoccus palaemonis]|uniref:Uncharacterized protein n=1 Tax=Tessaracoccus palaemonis TaxID=2829499 RepID=A0ABX8SH86_9ACTN|nr:hypothetical protein [Tessaracoccus palaemonis]QXT62319.1 hypothetical protein KDB89_11240 [Tessaracoccus palaemonis]